MTSRHGDRTLPPLRVVWSRGHGCAELAEALDPDTRRVSGDLVDSCVDYGADLLVRKKLVTSFDLVGTAAPSDLDLDRVAAVAALVSGGPHSRLAARIAAELGSSLGVHARMACAYQDESDQEQALTTVERLYREVPTLEYSILHGAGAAEMLNHLAADTLVVVGAPGGSWLQRQFFGKGARLVSKAPAGAIVVQAAPPRVFGRMSEPVYVARHLGAGDAVRLHPEPLIAVVEGGKLIGTVTRSSLLMAGDGPVVEACMTEPVSVLHTETVDVAEELSSLHGGAPIPVVDGGNNLVGMFGDTHASR